MNPLKPTRHHPGSKGKLRVLRARARAEAPLFLEGDAQGLRQLQERTQVHSTSSPLERAIMAHIDYKPQKARALAARIGIRAGQSFRRALMLLRQAGVLAYGRRGWRLVRT
jgi:hypothetical protein